MRTMAALAVAAAMTMGVSMSGCGLRAEDGSGNDGFANVTLTGSSEVTLRVGGELKVALAANPSTGYGWEVSTAPEPAVLEQVGEPVYEATPTDTMVVGSGGTTTFRFRAEAAGTTEVVLVYRRPWEEGVEPVDTVTVEVTVEG